MRKDISICSSFLTIREERLLKKCAESEVTSRDGADHRPLVGSRWTSVQKTLGGTRQVDYGCLLGESERKFRP